MTIRLEEEEYKCLQAWADNEFLTVPQLAKVVLKKAIANYQKDHLAKND